MDFGWSALSRTITVEIAMNMRSTTYCGLTTLFMGIGLLLILLPVGVRAQVQTFQGMVLDLRSDEPMQYVRVRNLADGTEAETGRDGGFKISARLNDLIRFDYPGYRTDTLVVTEFDLKRVYLTPNDTEYRLEEVEVQAMTNAQLHAELARAKEEGQIMDVSIHRGGIRLSPSRIFGKSAQQARQRYQILLAEKDRRLIGQRFNAKAVQALTPLEGSDLDLFLLHYRPDIEFVERASNVDFNLYIMDSFAAFNKLTPEQKAALRQLDKSHDK